jgi:hypothetical protein
VLGRNLVTINNQIAKLESGAVTANDIVGTYALVSHLTAVGEPANVTAGHDVGTLTFHADGTGTLRKTSRASGLVGSPMVLGHHSGAPIDTPFNWQLSGFAADRAGRCQPVATTGDDSGGFAETDADSSGELKVMTCGDLLPEVLRRHQFAAADRAGSNPAPATN